MKRFIVLLITAAVYSCGGNSTENTESYPIISGDIWLDTDGNMINAHRGGVLFHEGVYYWYGEYKGDSTYWNPKVPSWECYRTEAGGVSYYSSRDLRTWKFEGVVLPSDKEDESSELHYSNVLERPKVIYNDNTGKFIMWLHVDSHDYAKAAAGVAVSDTPNGRFEYLGSVRPYGQMSRDMTLFKNDDGRAYHFFSSEENATLYIGLLSDDYLSHEGTYTRNFIDESREAPAVFKHNGKYYLITSGCTAWDPNQAEYAVAENIMGPWTTMGDPCSGKDAEIIFYGQSTNVIKVKGKENAFIAMFDKWNKIDLIDSRYIWLPVEFRQDDTIDIAWRDSWTPDEVF